MSRTVATTVSIDAPIENVWRIMTDLPGYQRWNDFVIRIDGPAEVRVGSSLKLHARLMPGVVSRLRLKVTAFAPPCDGEAALVYEVVGWMAHGVAATRTQALIATGDGVCRYETREVFSGPLHSLVPYGLVQRGTQRHADGLKRAAEGE